MGHSTASGVRAAIAAASVGAKRSAIAASAATIEDILAAGQTVYGVNTGFGLLANTSIAANDLETLQKNLVLSHACGVGPLLDDAVVRNKSIHYLPSGWEPVIERNPDVIVIVNYGNVTAEEKIAFMKDNPAFKDIPAVRDDRFVVLEYVEATPGPRNIEAVKRLAAAFAAK